jgi:hypothetical protein
MRHDGYIDFSTDKESGGREVRIGFKGTNESVIYARGALESTRGIIKNKKYYYSNTRKERIIL